MKPIYPVMFAVSLALVVLAAGLFWTYGLNLGVDFTGGSVLEITFTNRPLAQDVSQVLKTLSVPALADVSINLAGQNNLIIRSGPLSEEQHQLVLQKIRDKFQLSEPKEVRFDSIGPAIGAELKRKSITGVALVLLAVVCYIALVFRTMRRVLSPWIMSFAAIVALLHDILIPIGVFAVLGKFYNIQVNAVFVAALLTVLGYSISDTVVVFDRVRENIIRGLKVSFTEIVQVSIKQTLVRSLNTTLTTLAALIAIWFFGGESIKYFALALILGITLGAYSSIFVASPLLVWLEKRRTNP